MTDNVRGFEIIVGINGNHDKQTAIAKASQYLAYGDHSNTFGEADIIEVNVYENGDYGVQISIAVNENNTQVEEFLDNMDLLQNVEQCEEFSYERVE